MKEREYSWIPSNFDDSPEIGPLTVKNQARKLRYYTLHPFLEHIRLAFIARCLGDGPPKQQQSIQTADCRIQR